MDCFSNRLTFEGQQRSPGEAAMKPDREFNSAPLAGHRRRHRQKNVCFTSSVCGGDVDASSNRLRQDTAKCLRQPDRFAAEREKIEVTVKTAMRLVAIDDVEELLLLRQSLKGFRNIIHWMTSVTA